MEHPIHLWTVSNLSRGYLCSHSPLKVIGFARIAVNCALASREVGVGLQMKLYTDSWPDLVSAEELSHGQRLSRLIVACLHAA